MNNDFLNELNKVKKRKKKMKERIYKENSW